MVELIKKETRVAVELVHWKDDFIMPAGTDVVVNATSIGLFPDVDARIALDLNSLKPGMVVADVIPNPPQTRLLREAAARGCKTLDGLGMLVNQGATNIGCWFGVDPDKSVMRAALERVFGA